MIVVTGATGNVGRELVRVLAEAGEGVTAVSRNSAPVPDGVRHVRADLLEPETLRQAFEGAEALFLMMTGEFAMAGTGLEGVLRLAEQAGIRRVVLLSSQGVQTRPESESHGQIGKIWEDEVRRSGLEWTILRPGGFASNSYAWAESIRERREVAAPFAEVGLPVVDPADIAEVASVALRKPEHSGQIYVLTGPAPVTPREQAEAIGKALGEPVRFVELTRAEAAAAMSRFMPAPIVGTTLDILGEPTPEEATVSPDVEHVLGRSPRTFAEWAERNATAFR